MSAQWYYKELGRILGPLTATELRQYAREDKIGPDTLIRKGPEGRWIPAAKIKGLFENPPSRELPTVVLPPVQEGLPPGTVSERKPDEDYHPPPSSLPPPPPNTSTPTVDNRKNPFLFMVPSTVLVLLTLLLHCLTCVWEVRSRNRMRFEQPILGLWNAVADEGARKKLETTESVYQSFDQDLEKKRIAWMDSNKPGTREYSERYNDYMFIREVTAKQLEKVSELKDVAEGHFGLWQRKGTARDSALIIGVVIPILLTLGALMLMTITGGERGGERGHRLFL